MTVRTTGKRFVWVATTFTLIAFFTVATAQGVVIPRLINGENLKIAAIGTSLTDANFNPQNWFTQTGAWLNSLPYSGKVTLSNRAVSGTASVNLPQRPLGGTWQLEQVLAYDNPDVIFIEFAINDAYKEFNITPAASANNLKTLINRIKGWATDNTKNVDIIVQTMNNTGPTYAPYENDTAPYYQAWREEAAANKVQLIDHEPNWVNLYTTNRTAWNGYIPDDIHPTTLGATNVILPEIQQVLLSQVPEPSCFALLGASLLGLIGYVACKWRRRRKQLLAI